jgi:tetratricopeptide (TPR) repeat protein
MRLRPLDCVVAATLLAFAASGTAAAMGPEPPAEQKKDAKKEQQSRLELREDYRVAYDLIYTQHDYAAGLARLHALRQDDHADVANLIGFASRKLGRYDDSKYWYERALASDPKHARTWSYYGMWHAEQGNLLKAQDYLTKVAGICGTECREYTELKGVIEGTRTY